MVSFSQGWAGIGTNQLPLSPARDNNFIFADHFSYVLGKHTLQTGISILNYNKTQASFNTTQGNYYFDGSFTRTPDCRLPARLGPYLLSGQGVVYPHLRRSFRPKLTFRTTGAHLANSRSTSASECSLFL